MCRSTASASAICLRAMRRCVRVISFRDYAKFLKEGSKFLQLDPPTDLYEALNSLMIFYKHVPSVTNYPVYVGQLDELLEPYIDTVDEAQAKKMLKLFLTQMDRTILDSFSPRKHRAA